MSEKKTLVLIDGHALAFRQYYALERTGMKNSDNQPTWAVYGFFKAIFDLLARIKPDFIAVTFDVGRQTFRVEKYEEYKANREAMPDTLRSQIGLIVEESSYFFSIFFFITNYFYSKTTTHLQFVINLFF